MRDDRRELEALTAAMEYIRDGSSYNNRAFRQEISQSQFQAMCAQIRAARRYLSEEVE